MQSGFNKERQRVQNFHWSQHCLQLKTKALRELEKKFNEQQVQAQNALNSLNNRIQSLQEDLRRKNESINMLEQERQEIARSVFLHRRLLYNYPDLCSM